MTKLPNIFEMELFYADTVRTFNIFKILYTNLSVSDSDQK